MRVLEWKERAVIGKVNSRCFCWFPAAILVHQNCTPIWRPAIQSSSKVPETFPQIAQKLGHKDLRLGQIVQKLVFYNISFSWLLPLDGFKCIFLCRVYCVTVKTKNYKAFWENFGVLRGGRTWRFDYTCVQYIYCTVFLSLSFACWSVKTKARSPM